MQKSPHELRRMVFNAACAGRNDTTIVRQRRVARSLVDLLAVALVMGCLIIGSASSAVGDFPEPPPDELYKPLDVAIKDVQAHWYRDLDLVPVVSWTPQIPSGLTQHQTIVLDVANVADPDPKARAALPPSITYVVGTGVPDLRGHTLGQADGIARQLGFTVQPTVGELGVVVSQVPHAGKLAPFGSTLTLVTSLLPRRATVPDLLGLSGAAARMRLDAVGLHLVVTRRSGRGPFKVVHQSPGPSSRVARGTAVGVALTGAAGQVTVPDLTGRTPKQARRTLTRLGLELHTASAGNSRAGVASHQSPRPGTLVDLGSTVTVTFSQPIPVQVASSPWSPGGVGLGAAVLVLLLAGVGTTFRRVRRRRHRPHRAPVLEVRPQQDSRPIVTVLPVDEHGDHHHHEDVAVSIRPVVGAVTTSLEELP